MPHSYRTMGLFTKEESMNIFIPSNEESDSLINKGFVFQPFVIEAYQCHFSEILPSEKTQNLFSKKVNIGTVTTKKGKTLVE